MSPDPVHRACPGLAWMVVPISLSSLFLFIYSLFKIVNWCLKQKETSF